MSSPNAFRATYADWKLIKTRGVVQVIFEVPLADHDVAYQVVGGMPDPAKERWFGIAPLNLSQRKEDHPNSEKPQAQPQPIPPAGAKRDWKDLQPAQQAGIRCEDPIFIAFLRETRMEQWREIEDAAAMVRLICVVNSRAQLNTSHPSRVMWHLLDEEFLAWKALEHA